ncbi:MAG: hypothetical protein F4213_11975 [Boseongicola sp. SB0677_bin_26]|nr:hypothetical protein [Boseongicola sp. SB0665_bin_10]MYG26723.1 hypothetical protein [Boseongicola sp. SB0677_bin_26]
MIPESVQFMAIGFAVALVVFATWATLETHWQTVRRLFKRGRTPPEPEPKRYLTAWASAREEKARLEAERAESDMKISQYQVRAAIARALTPIQVRPDGKTNETDT